jgi:hypothetical protein
MYAFLDVSKVKLVIILFKKQIIIINLLVQGLGNFAFKVMK